MRQFRQFRPTCNLDQESADISSRLNIQLMRNLRNQRPKVVHYEEPLMPRDAQIQSYRDRRSIHSQLELKRAMNTGEMHSQLILQEQMILQLKEQIQSLESQLKLQNKEQQNAHQSVLTKISSPGRPRSAGLLKSIRAENLQQNILNYKLNQLQVESTQLVQQNKINQLERQLENYKLQIQSYKDSIAEKSFTTLIDLKDQEIMQLQKNFTDIAAKQRVYETTMLNQEDQIFELKQLSDIYKKQLRAVLGKKAFDEDSQIEQSGSMGSSGPQLSPTEQKQYSKQVMQELSQYIKIVDNQKYKIEQQQKQLLEKEEITLKLINELNRLKEDVKAKEESLFILNKGLQVNDAIQVEQKRQAELKAELGQKEDAISTLKLEKIDLEAQLNEKNNKINELTQQISTHQNTIDQQNDQIAANNNTCEVLNETQQKLESYQQSYQEKSEALTKAEKKLETQQNTINELTSKIDEQTTQLEEFQTLIDQLRNEIATKDTEIQNIQQTCTDLNTKFQDAENVIQSNQNEIAQLQTTIQQKQTEYDTIYEQLQAAMKEHTDEQEKKQEQITEEVHVENEESAKQVEPSVHSEKEKEQKAQLNNYGIIADNFSKEEPNEVEQQEIIETHHIVETVVNEHKLVDENTNDQAQEKEEERGEHHSFDSQNEPSAKEHEEIQKDTQQNAYELINQAIQSNTNDIDNIYGEKLADYAHQLDDSLEIKHDDNHCISTIIGSVALEERVEGESVEFQHEPDAQLEQHEENKAKDEVTEPYDHYEHHEYHEQAEYPAQDEHEKQGDENNVVSAYEFIATGLADAHTDHSEAIPDAEQPVENGEHIVEVTEVVEKLPETAENEHPHEIVESVEIVETIQTVEDPAEAEEKQEATEVAENASPVPEKPENDVLGHYEGLAQAFTHEDTQSHEQDPTDHLEGENEVKSEARDGVEPEVEQVMQEEIKTDVEDEIIDQQKSFEDEAPGVVQSLIKTVSGEVTEDAGQNGGLENFQTVAAAFGARNEEKEKSEEMQKEESLEKDEKEEKSAIQEVHELQDAPENHENNDREDVEVQETHANQKADAEVHEIREHCDAPETNEETETQPNNVDNLSSNLSNQKSHHDEMQEDSQHFNENNEVELEKEVEQEKLETKEAETKPEELENNGLRLYQIISDEAHQTAEADSHNEPEVITAGGHEQNEGHKSIDEALNGVPVTLEENSGF